MSLIMESFFVFVIMECFAILYYILYFHYEPKKIEKKIWDPLGLQTNKGAAKWVKKSKM